MQGGLWKPGPEGQGEGICYEGGQKKPHAADLETPRADRVTWGQKERQKGETVGNGLWHLATKKLLTAFPTQENLQSYTHEGKKGNMLLQRIKVTAHRANVTSPREVMITAKNHNSKKPGEI